MTPIEINYWLDQAAPEQVERAKVAGQLSHQFWLKQGLHPLDTLAPIDAAVTLEIIAMGGLRVVGRA